MNTSNTNRRFWEVMIGIGLLFIGIAPMLGGQFFPEVLFVLGGFYLLGRQFDRTRQWVETGRTYQEENEPVVQHRDQQIYVHALEAVRSAGLDPNDTQVLPVDVGLMAFSGDADPVVYRTLPVRDDIDYLQPFVILRLPVKAAGRIRFEIVDSDGQSLFIHEENHQLERGRNLITPAARLPIHDAQAMSDAWELRVTADDTLLASHRFWWQETTGKVLRQEISEDGEITSEMRAMLQENRLPKMSLDDLLASQEAEVQRQTRR